MTELASIPATRHVLRVRVTDQPRASSASPTRPPAHDPAMAVRPGITEEAELEQVEAALLDEVAGEPGEEERDDEVEAGEAGDHPPDGAVPEQVPDAAAVLPGAGRSLLLDHLVLGRDVRELGLVDGPVRLRRAEVRPPADHPQETEHAHDHEDRSPAEEADDGRDDRDRQRGPDARPAVVEGGGPAALPLREPLGHGLRTRRVGAGLADPQS